MRSKTLQLRCADFPPFCQKWWLQKPTPWQREESWVRTTFFQHFDHAHTELSVAMDLIVCSTLTLRDELWCINRVERCVEAEAVGNNTEESSVEWCRGRDVQIIEKAHCQQTLSFWQKLMRMVSGPKSYHTYRKGTFCVQHIDEIHAHAKHTTWDGAEHMEYHATEDQHPSHARYAASHVWQTCWWCHHMIGYVAVHFFQTTHYFSVYTCWHSRTRNICVKA